MGNGCKLCRMEAARRVPARVTAELGDIVLGDPPDFPFLFIEIGGNSQGVERLRHGRGGVIR